MKDAKGHGSDPHSDGVQQIGKPSMQRRQYEAIAGAINSYGADHPDVQGALAQHFAGALVGTNPNFQSDKFRRAAMTGDMGRTQNKAPGMQSRHYEAVASAIKSFPGSDDTRNSIAQHFASRLGSSNANFNPDRFVKAAGGTVARDLSGRSKQDIKKDYAP